MRLLSTLWPGVLGLILGSIISVSSHTDARDVRKWIADNPDRFKVFIASGEIPVERGEHEVSGNVMGAHCVDEHDGILWVVVQQPEGDE